MVYLKQVSKHAKVVLRAFSMRLSDIALQLRHGGLKQQEVPQLTLQGEDMISVFLRSTFFDPVETKA